jgi:hypothetical protein
LEYEVWIEMQVKT